MFGTESIKYGYYQVIDVFFILYITKDSIIYFLVKDIQNFFSSNFDLVGNISDRS